MKTHAPIKIDARCDQCGARSYVMASKQDLVLYFCRHDFTKNSLKLERDGWNVLYDIDGLERLVTNGQKVLV